MKFKSKFKRILAGIISISITAMGLPLEIKASAADSTPLITDYRPVITESVDASGFKHPGVGLTKDILENMREEVIAKKDPWYSYYKAMTLSTYASKTVKCQKESTTVPGTPATVNFNSKGEFVADGLTAYTQALMYYITGDEVYRSNAMNIIRIWSQLDSKQYEYFADSHIHIGIPLNRMVTAAEILRYTSCQTESLKWTENDTKYFTENLIDPTIKTFLYDNNHFMNQHLYPLLGAMSGYIFTGNLEKYKESVEWFTVNKTATDQGQNGSIKQLFRLVEENALTGEKLATPRVQHVEMGRDLAHGAGDPTNMAYLSRMLLAQGTKVDPVQGIVSTAGNAVNPYQFLDNRILKAEDYFWRYMLGYETPWTPVAAHTDANGNPTIIYRILSDSYRGRMNTANFWDTYYYYKYTLGIDMEKEAPYFAEAFAKKIPLNYYYQGKAATSWESPDGGGDFWIYIPKEAEAEGSQYVPKEQTDASLMQIEDRYTVFDNNSVTKQEGEVSYIETTATEGGSKFAAISVSYPDRTKACIAGLKFRTNGVAKLEMSKDINSTPYHTLTLPDTKGQWRYMTYDMGIGKVSFSQIDKDYSLFYFNIVGANTTVDIDCINVDTSGLTPPVFKAGNTDLNLFVYAGSSIPTTYDFSATDAVTTDTVTYQIDNNPAGADINSSTGQFSWTPSGEQVGTYSMVVSASDGTSVTTKNVKIQVTNDRQSAVAAAIAPYDEDTSYESETLDVYNAAYNDVMSTIDTSTDDVFNQKLSNLRTAVEKLKLLTPLLADGSINYPSLVTSTAVDYTSSLIDDNPNSYPALGLAPGLYHTFDFGANFKVSASAFDLQVRMGFPERMAGTAVFGSNDGDTWTQLTDETQFTEDKQRLQVKDEYKNTKFRFIKIHMINPQSSFDSNLTSNMFEVSEFKIFGERHEIQNVFSSINISSNKSIKNRIVRGDTVKLSFTSKEKLSDVTVSIQGKDATVDTADNLNWTAEAVMDENVETGKVKFIISYKAETRAEKEEAYLTTDNSTLFIADETGLINFISDTTTKIFTTNVSGVIGLIDPTTTTGRANNQAATFTQVGYLFDSNLDTKLCSDFRLGSNAIGGYITFDFKAGNEVSIGKAEIIARQDQVSRIKYTKIQGSNDNSTWIDLTKDTDAVATAEWQTLKSIDSTPYRYIRVINTKTAWYGNVAELRLYTNALSKIEIKPDKILELGKTEQLDVTGIFNNGSRVNLLTTTGAAVTYTSSDPSIISVDDTGKVTGNKEGNADVTVNVNLNGQTLSKTVNLSVNIVSDNTVTSVESLSDIQVSIGTDKNDIGLPNNVDITLGNSTTTSAAVTWDNGNLNYDGNTSGTYTFTGILELPSGVTNPNNLQASIDVIVKEADSQIPNPDDEDNTTKPELPTVVKIQGTERVGKTLEGVLLMEEGTKFTTSSSVTYEWYRLSSENDNNGKLVGEDESYKLTGNDKGKYIKLIVIYDGDIFEDITGKIARSSSSSSSSSSSTSGSTTTSTNTTTPPSAPTAQTPILSTNSDGTVKLVDNNGQPLIGWQKINGNWYLADVAGIAKTGWQLVRGKWYFMAPNGVMQIGWQQLDGKWYLLNNDGAMLTGWQQVNSKWYYLYTDGSMASDTVIEGYRLDASGAWG